MGEGVMGIHVLKIWPRKHYFMPFLMDLKSINDTFQSNWRALFGNLEGTFIYGLNEGRGSSLSSLALDARLHFAEPCQHRDHIRQGYTGWTFVNIVK